MKKLFLLLTLFFPGQIFGLVNLISEQETTRLNTLLEKIAQPKVSRFGKEAHTNNFLRATTSFIVEGTREIYVQYFESENEIFAPFVSYTRNNLIRDYDSKLFTQHSQFSKNHYGSALKGTDGYICYDIEYVSLTKQSVKNALFNVITSCALLQNLYSVNTPLITVLEEVKTRAGDLLLKLNAATSDNFESSDDDDSDEDDGILKPISRTTQTIQSDSISSSDDELEYFSQPSSSTSYPPKTLPLPDQAQFQETVLTPQEQAEIQFLNDFDDDFFTGTYQPKITDAPRKMRYKRERGGFDLITPPEALHFRNLTDNENEYRQPPLPHTPSGSDRESESGSDDDDEFPPLFT